MVGWIQSLCRVLLLKGVELMPAGGIGAALGGNVGTNMYSDWQSDCYAGFPSGSDVSSCNAAAIKTGYVGTGSVAGALILGATVGGISDLVARSRGTTIP